MTREQVLAHTRRLASVPFEYGTCDCLLALADWVQVCTGTDLGAGYRGQYSTRVGYMRLVAKAGGIEALVGSLLARVGWHPVPQPRTGDVGVLQLGLLGKAGGLLAGGLWVLKMGRGVVGVRTPPAVLQAWGPR